MSTRKNGMKTVEEALPVGTMDFEADAGAGLEGADKSSYAIPFIVMLQGLSPQLETIERAKPGRLINTITNELYDKIRVIPCAFQRRFLRWAPRSAGGGFKGEYNPAEVETFSVPGLRVIDGMYMMDVPEGANAFDAKGLPLYDHLADTRNHFVLVESTSGSWTPALISLSSTQVKKSKRWMSRIQGLEIKNARGKIFNPPSFSHIYVASATKEANAKGEWWGWDINLEGPVEDPDLYAKAKAFHAQVVAGTIEVAPPPTADAASEGNDGF